MENSYVTIYEEYKHKFIRIPKVFFVNEKYKKMSNNSKVAWALLNERSSLSRKNNWFDEETGRIYFIFKNKDLMQLLNIRSESTLIKVKKELIQNDLIEEKRMGFNRPNKLYLKYPIVKKQDVLNIDSFEQYEYKTVDTQGTIKNGTPKNVGHELQKMKSSYTNYNLDTLDTNIDTRDHDENITDEINPRKDSEKEQLKKAYMEKGFYENSERVPERLANMLKAFSADMNQSQKYYEIVLIAKKRVEKELGFVIWLEQEPELEYQLINAFSRAVRQIEQQQTVENGDGYIYKTIYNVLLNELLTRLRNSNQPDPVYYDWLEEGKAKAVIPEWFKKKKEKY